MKESRQVRRQRERQAKKPVQDTIRRCSQAETRILHNRLRRISEGKTVWPPATAEELGNFE